MQEQPSSQIEEPAKRPLWVWALAGVAILALLCLALVIVGAVRELLGSGSVFGMHVMWSSFEPFGFMLKAPGAFVCLGFLLGIMNIIGAKK